MDPLSITLSITALLKLTKDVVLYVKEAKDASDERKKFVRETSGLSGMLTTLIDFVNEEDPGNPWLLAVLELVAKDGPFDQFALALQELKAKIAPTSGMRKVGQMLVWKHIKEEVQALLSQIERLKTLVGVALEVDHMRLSLEIKSTLAGMTADIAKLHASSNVTEHNTTAILNYTSARHKKELLNRICNIDYLQQHRDVIARHQHGTGDWFLNDLTYQSWTSSPSGILVCPGVPGAGKTTIASLVIEHHLRAVHFQRPVVFIYYNYKSQDQQDLRHTLETILRQVVNCLPRPSNLVSDVYASEMPRTPTTEEVKQILYGLLVHLQGLTIITDALDECQNRARHEILSFIAELRGRITVRYMSTTRDFHLSASHQVFEDSLVLKIEATRHDLEVYTRLRAQSLHVRVQRDLLEELVNGVVTATQGMFLLAILLMDSFQAKLTVKRIKDDLHSLPRGLDAYDAAYQGAMTRILGQEEEHRDLASRILSLILCAKRPLSTLQVRHALMIQIGDIELDHDSILEVEDILSVCAGLLAVDEKSESIRFVHYTAQEYLQRTREQWLPGAESQIARMCLATLLLEEHAVHKPTLNRSALNLLISSASKFTEYAAMCTLVHLDSIWHDEPSLHACFLTLLKGSRVLSAVEQLDFGYKAHHSHSPTALHLVAYLGLANLTAFCIANGYTVNSKDRQGRTPISYAAEEGHATVAFVLLENQATVDAPDKGSRTPLWYAARKGHKSVVFLLLEKQAAVNPTDQFSRTPLWYAAKAGHESIVRLLLEKQATANFFDTELTTPLSLAARGGHTPVVLLLLEQRAAVNSRDRYSRTPLWHAARAGQESIVLSLLEKRATVDSADQDSVTPLSCAARGGYKSVVSILLDKGASVDSKCRTGRTPLSYAAEWGRVEVVELLLSKGADPLLKSVFGGEPLWYAVHSASSQNYEVVDLMCRAIELRQSLNIKDTDIIASKHAKPPPDTRPTPLPTQDQSLPSPSVSNPSDQVPVDPTMTNHCSSPTTFPQ